MTSRPRRSTLFPYTTLFRSGESELLGASESRPAAQEKTGFSLPPLTPQPLSPPGWGERGPERIKSIGVTRSPRWVAVVAGVALALACAGRPAAEPVRPLPVPATATAPAAPLSAADAAFLDEVQERTFRFFWDLADPGTGLIPDRWPTKSFASVAATGFGLTAYPIGVERGWVTREQARERVLRTLRFLWNAPQGDGATGVTGYRGFFYHFLHLDSGLRFERVELSTIDTTLLLAGVLFCGEYFDGDAPEEREIRDLAERLFARVEWTWAQPEPPAVSHGWHPEKGWIESDWRGYNEAMLLYLMALGSPAHPIDPAGWD